LRGWSGSPPKEDDARGLRGRYSGNPPVKEDGNDRELGVMNPPNMDVREFVGVDVRRFVGIDDRNPIPGPPRNWALPGGDTDRTPVMERPEMTQSLMMRDIESSH
jgi:hypothetical protein